MHKKDKRAPTGYEVQVSKINIIGLSNEFPIQKDLNEELLGDRRHLWLRPRKMTAILKIRSSYVQARDEFFKNVRCAGHFNHLHSPELYAML